MFAGWLNGRTVRINIFFWFGLVWVGCRSSIIPENIGTVIILCKQYDYYYMHVCTLWQHKAIIDMVYHIFDDWRFHDQDSPISFNHRFNLLPRPPLCALFLFVYAHCTHINDYDDKVHMIGSYNIFMKEQKIRIVKASRGVNGGAHSKCNHTYIVHVYSDFPSFFSFLSSPFLPLFLRRVRVRFRRAMLSHP